MNLWRTVRDLLRNDVPLRPHACHCGRVITRLPRRSHQAWLGGGFHIACPRCGRRMWPIPHPAGRLIADLKAAAAESPRDGRTPNAPQKGQES